MTASPVKMLQLAHPRDGISEQEFHDHWRHPHATLVRGIRPIRGYVQHHRVRSDVFADSDSTYLAVAEVWFDSMAAAALDQDPQYVAHVGPDEPSFVDQSKHLITFTVEDVVQAHRGAVDPEASAADLYWSDKDSGTWATLLQFVRDHDVDTTTEESLELSRRLGAFRHVVNRSVVDDSEIAMIREISWPSQFAFEEAVRADGAAFESLRAVPSSFLYLARSERVF